MSAEYSVDELDLAQPLHRRDRIPTWHDEAQRMAMLEGQRLAVHRVGEENVTVARVVERKTALETDRARRIVRAPAVSAAEQDVLRTVLDAGTIQDFDQRHTRP